MADQPTTTQNKYTYKYWCDELKASGEDRREFLEIASKSIKVYKKEHKLDDVSREMGIWWSLVNTLMPAYFSRIPKVDVELRKKRGNLEARLAGLTWEAATQYAIEEHFDFNSIGYQAVLQFLLTGQGVLWARYAPEIEDKEYEYALLKSDDGSYKTDKGDAYTGKSEVVERDGRGYAKEMVPTKVGERAVLDVVNYKDYRCSVARSPEEITW